MAHWAPVLAWLALPYCSRRFHRCALICIVDHLRCAAPQAQFETTSAHIGIPSQQSFCMQRDVHVDARTVTLQHFQVVEDEQKVSRRLGIGCAAASAIQLAIALRGSASANKAWLGLGAANSVLSCALACGRVTSTARRSPAAARRSTTMGPALLEASAHGVFAATLAWRSTC